MTLPPWIPRATIRTLTTSDILRLGLTLEPDATWRAFVLEVGQWGMVAVAWPAKPTPAP